MDISSSLLAKGAAGALAATAAVGTGVAAKEGLFDNFLKANSESVNVENPEGNEQREAIDDSSKETTRSTNPESEVGLSGGNDDASGHTINPVSEPIQGTISSVGGSPGSQGEGSSELGTGLPNGTTDSHSPDRTDSETQGKKAELTKFDQGLIDFLKAEGDIVFEVKKGNGTNDFTEADLDLSSSNPLPITAKVNIDTSGNAGNLIEKGDAEDGGKGKITTLQKLNGTDATGTPWTWTCKVKLKTADNPPAIDVNGKSIHDKDKIFSSNEKGLFNLLKKRASGETDDDAKQKLRGIKEKFIKSCAKERTNNENIKETLVNSKLESTIVINLKPGAAGLANKTETDKLYPAGGKNDEKFKELFEETTSQPSAQA